MDGRFDPALTMREKVTELTKSETCQTCHRIINPLGFSLEHYDSVGRFRDQDNRKPVNSSSEYATEDGSVTTLTGARDLAEMAAGSKQAQQGFIEHLFHHLTKQATLAYGSDTTERLRNNFETSGFNIKELIVDIALTDAMFAQ